MGKVTRPLQENPILIHCSENKIQVSIITYKALERTYKSFIKSPLKQ